MGHDLSTSRTFGFLVQDVARLVKRHFEHRARQNGLPITRRQAAVLIHISRHEGVSQAEVATVLDLEPIALVRLLDRLCEEGWVERRAHPTDRRVRTLWLTHAARPVLASILQINEAIRADAFAGIPPPQRAALTDALAAVKENLALDQDAADPTSGCERAMAPGATLARQAAEGSSTAETPG
jgi:MarR family transcriptional regulator, transcriptional regulator for hemolysin